MNKVPVGQQELTNKACGHRPRRRPKRPPKRRRAAARPRNSPRRRERPMRRLLRRSRRLLRRPRRPRGRMRRSTKRAVRPGRRRRRRKRRVRLRRRKKFSRRAKRRPPAWRLFGCAVSSSYSASDNVEAELEVCFAHRRRWRSSGRWRRRPGARRKRSYCATLLV